MAETGMGETADTQIGNGDSAESLSEEVKQKAEELKEKANQFFKSMIFDYYE
jgi:hypothetical protein